MPPRLLPAGPRALALFRRLFLEKLLAAHKAGRFRFFGEHAALADAQAFAAHLHRCAEPNGWSMPSARSADPSRAAYLSRYTHRVRHRQQPADRLRPHPASPSWKTIVPMSRAAEDHDTHTGEFIRGS